MRTVSATPAPVREGLCPLSFPRRSKAGEVPDIALGKTLDTPALGLGPAILKAYGALSISVEKIPVNGLGSCASRGGPAAFSIENPNPSRLRDAGGSLSVGMSAL